MCPKICKNWSRGSVWANVWNIRLCMTDALLCRVLRRRRLLRCLYWETLILMLLSSSRWKQAESVVKSCRRTACYNAWLLIDWQIWVIDWSLNCLQVLQNVDDLFERDELSAAPDVGWPDCFNSGVFVYRPSVDTYTALLQLAVTHGSFDGKWCSACSCMLPCDCENVTAVCGIARWPHTDWLTLKHFDFAAGVRACALW